MLYLMTAQNSFKIYCGARLLLHREGSPRSLASSTLRLIFKGCSYLLSGSRNPLERIISMCGK